MATMQWVALRVPPSLQQTPDAEPGAPAPASQLEAVGWWALQFTPRVAQLEEAIVLEVSSSLRLFGGTDALRARLQADAPGIGCDCVAWAPTAHAALALSRAGEKDGFARPLAQLLDPLPLASISAVGTEESTWAQLGCHCLGDVRRLPRGGVSRRFGAAVLDALDRTYGLSPETFAWLSLPETFAARLELPGRVELAEGLLYGARQLLNQMAGWLAARHAGVRSFTFTWIYDTHRGRDAPPSAQLQIRTGDLTRQTDHFTRLLREQLGHIQLQASVETIWLRADDVAPLMEQTASLLPEDVRPGESLTQLIERVSARLGEHKVLRSVVRADHRPERVQAWQPACRPMPRRLVQLPVCPQPTWLLETPVQLAMRGQRPVYQGVLEMVVGPSRMEAGWWDREVATAGEAPAVARDYFLMDSPHAGLLWVYRERAAGVDGSPWFLHGIFA